MKYLMKAKNFTESKKYKPKLFWFIPYNTNNSLFKLAVDKLPTSKEIKNEILNNDFFSSSSHIGVFIAIPGVFKSNFSYYLIDDEKDKEKGMKSHHSYGFTYEGEVKPEDYEIDASKYNL